MPLTTHTVTLTTRFPGSTLPLDGTWTLSVAATPAVFKETATGIVFGHVRNEHTVAGTKVFTLEATGQAGLLPVDGRWQLSFRSDDGKFTLGPLVFNLTGPMDLDDILEVSGLPPTVTILSQVLAARDEVEADRVATETAAASVQREQPSGVAGLTTAGKLYEVRIPDRLSDASLSGTFAKRGPALSDYNGRILYMAHRGGLNVYPEHTLEGFRAALAAGVECLEMDISPLGDATAGLLHDATIDRVMTGTGSPAKFTAGTWQAQVVDCATWFSPAWLNSRGVTFEEVARTFGGRIILSPEAKVDVRTGRSVTSIVQKYGLEDSTVIWTFYTQFLVDAVAAGLSCGFVSPDGLVDPATLPGYTWVMVDKGVCTDARIGVLKDAGMKVAVYTINRHWERDRYAALGVSGIVTDEPVYLDGDLGLYLNSDPFATSTPYSGQLSNVLDRGTASGGKLSTGSLGGKTFILQGWMHPWLSPRKAAAYKIDATLTFDALGSNATNWLSIVFGQLKDETYSNTAAVGNTGYLLMLRVNGELALYRENNGAGATLLGTVASAALAAGGTATIRIEVSPTGVTVRRTDGTPVAITTTDTTYRGSYVYFGRNDSGSAGLRGSFSGVQLIAG